MLRAAAVRLLRFAQFLRAGYGAQRAAAQQQNAFSIVAPPFPPQPAKIGRVRGPRFGSAPAYGVWYWSDTRLTQRYGFASFGRSPHAGLFSTAASGAGLTRGLDPLRLPVADSRKGMEGRRGRKQQSASSNLQIAKAKSDRFTIEGHPFDSAQGRLRSVKGGSTDRSVCATRAREAGKRA